MGHASPFADWGNFYVIVGSSAGALTGLQFVVLTLVAQTEAAGSMAEIRAFGSPTVVHFCMVLLVAAIMSAPWHALSGCGTCLTICAVAGLVYAISVIRHARRQQGYKADAEDWAWYIVLPLVAYAILVIGATLLASHQRLSLLLIAGTTLLLLFIGIHNAWDTVTYVAVGRHHR